MPKPKKAKPAKVAKKAQPKKASARKSASKKPAAKKPVAKKKVAKKAVSKKAVAKKSVAKKSPAAKKPSKPAPKKPVAKKKAAKAVKSAQKPVKTTAKTVKAKKPAAPKQKPVDQPIALPKPGPVKMTPFLKTQQQKLLQLRDGMLDSMNGVARDTLRSRAEGSEASAFGMHQADAGSDAYDRDFALSLLSQEQDALYEIDEALKRIELGTYGVCEMSGKAIPHARLEAIPFARLTVECQSQVEKQRKLSRTRQPVTSLFGLTDEEGGESDEEEATSESKE